MNPLKKAMMGKQMFSVYSCWKKAKQFLSWAILVQLYRNVTHHVCSLLLTIELWYLNGILCIQPANVNEHFLQYFYESLIDGITARVACLSVHVKKFSLPRRNFLPPHRTQVKYINKQIIVDHLTDFGWSCFIHLGLFGTHATNYWQFTDNFSLNFYD